MLIQKSGCSFVDCCWCCSIEKQLLMNKYIKVMWTAGYCYDYCGKDSFFTIQQFYWHYHIQRGRFLLSDLFLTIALNSALVQNVVVPISDNLKLNSFESFENKKCCLIRKHWALW